MTGLPNPDVKRARPQMNVYTCLLLVATLMGIVAVTAVALSNMHATGDGPFDVAKSR